MAQFESLLGRPLGRVVCLCHQVELPYRALFQSVDGKTTGPTTFSGPIGKSIAEDVHRLKIADCPVIQCSDFPEIPPATASSLSSDLKLLYRSAKAVVSGNVEGLAGLRHGKLCMARWYTAQSRLLRLYMSQAEPSPDLTTLARYIVCVYVPVVMAIKQRPDVVDAPAHICDTLRRQHQHLEGDSLDVVVKNTKRNTYMAHPENVLLAMLGDQNHEVRAQGVDHIRNIRANTASTTNNNTSRPVCSFRTPAVNTAAARYTELVDVKELVDDGMDIEPPSTKAMSDLEIDNFLLEPLTTGVPSHTQSTERAVKATTEAVAAISGQDRQDGLSQQNSVPAQAWWPGYEEAVSGEQ